MKHNFPNITQQTEEMQADIAVITPNYTAFFQVYLKHLEHCIKFDADYLYTKQTCTDIPALAHKMIQGLIKGSASNAGKAIKLTCKELKIKSTYQAIKEFLNKKEN